MTPTDSKLLFDLSGKVAVVTGASGMLGATISEALAKFGADLVLAGRNTKKLEKVSESLGPGRRTLVVKTDVTKESDVENLASQALKKFGRVDILVAGAGANILKPSKDFGADDFETLMRINTEGTFLCDREIGKIMLEQKKGKIVNISSIRGWFATSANTLGYSASKAAVNMITRVLACEWAPYNINVNAIAPAMVATGMHTASPEGETLQLDQKILDGIVRRTPMKRLAQPDDLIGAIIFLSSEASNFITGQILYIDGGASVWAA